MALRECRNRNHNDEPDSIRRKRQTKGQSANQLTARYVPANCKGRKELFPITYRITDTRVLRLCARLFEHRVALTIHPANFLCTAVG